MKLPRHLILGAAVVFAVACGRGAEDDTAHAEAAPDFDGLALEIAGTAEEGVSSTGQPLESEGLSQRQDGLSDPPEYLKHGREAIRALNQYLRRVLEPIAELVAQGAGKTQPGDVKVYGPKDKSGVTYLFTIKRVSEGRFHWKLEAKPTGKGDEAYRIVLAGSLAKGDKPHRGRGAVGIDLDALKSVDPSAKGVGKLFAAFAHVGDTKTLVYRLKGFTPDTAAHDPVNAAFVGHRLMPSRATAIRLAALVNLADSPTAAKELVRARIRYLPGVGGRADVLATGGDVPQDKVYFGRACWDAQEKEGFAILRLCSRAQPLSCQVVAVRGQPANCKLGADQDEAPAENANDEKPEPEAPAQDLVAPDSMPQF